MPGFYRLALRSGGSVSYMHSIGSHLKQIAFLAIVTTAGCAGSVVSAREHYSEIYSETAQGALRASPRVLGRHESFVLTLPSPHPKSVAIRAPNGDWFYFEDPI